MLNSAEVNSIIDEDKDAGIGQIGRIPIRNLWLLMLYASDLFRELGKGNVSVEENPEDIPNLVANILSYIVERRLKRNLSFGYQSKDAILNCIRGKIDLITTERHQLLSRGKVACCFDDFTVNTPRNRFVRAALYAIAKITTCPDLKHRCRCLADNLKQLGVSGEKPTRNEVNLYRFGRNDSNDKLMVSAAQLAFDLALPTEDAGNIHMLMPDREEKWIRRLFEKAVGGFYDVVLSSQGWRVSTGKTQNWIIDYKTDRINELLPSMRTDIVLDHQVDKKRIIIDTKFNSIVTPGWFKNESFRSGYLYQIYAYLRSQEGNGDPLSDNASGMLLHPSIGELIDETVLIQNHAIRFATIDLSKQANIISDQLIKMVKFPPIR